jgi:hypothetical protein
MTILVKPPHSSQFVRPLAKSLTLAAMSLGYGIVQLDVTIVNTALNNIGDSLGGGVSELQWIVSAYTIAFAALILTRSAISGAVSLRSWRGPDKVDAIVCFTVRWQRSFLEAVNPSFRPPIKPMPRVRPAQRRGSALSRCHRDPP